MPETVSQLKLPIPILRRPVEDGFLIVSCYDSPDAELLVHPFITSRRRAGRIPIIGYLWDMDHSSLDVDMASGAIEPTLDNLLTYGSSEVRCYPPSNYEFRIEFESGTYDQVEQLIDAPSIPGFRNIQDCRLGEILIAVERPHLTAACRRLVEILPKFVVPYPGPNLTWGDLRRQREECGLPPIDLPEDEASSE